MSSGHRIVVCECGKQMAEDYMYKGYCPACVKKYFCRNCGLFIKGNAYPGNNGNSLCEDCFEDESYND